MSLALHSTSGYGVTAHRVMAPSPEPEAGVAPSGTESALFTTPMWPVRMRLRASFAASHKMSHKMSVPSREPAHRPTTSRLFLGVRYA